MLMFTLYLILQLNSFIAFFGLGGAIFLVFSGICVLNQANCSSYQVETAAVWSKWKKIWAVLGICFVFIATVLPSSKSATIMAGGWVLKEVVETDAAKSMASNSIKIIENWLAEKAKP